MTALLRREAENPSFMTFLGSMIVSLIIVYLTASAGAQGTVTITGVSPNHSSVRVFYAPVPGARDYRIYDATNPRNVKYAGLVHLQASTTCPGQYCGHHFVAEADGVTPVFPYRVATGATGGPQVLDVPALQIDWNNVGDGAPHSVIVEAVDALGPVPQASLYTGEYNTPMVSPLPAGAMVGGNKGPTSDGNTSTNGQGPYTNVPRMIARSQPIVVQADANYRAVPSRASATQTFFDTFENAENASIVRVAREDRLLDAYLNIGWMKWLMNQGTSRAWEIEYRQADNNNSMPFISSDHFMDVLFDGGTQGSGAPGHMNVGSMSMTPVQTVTLAGGRILHMTMEVDGHQSQRRWLAFNLAPASDPLQAWHPDGGVPTNNTNQAMFLEIKDGGCTLDIYTGSGANRTPIGTAGGGTSRLWGGNTGVSCNLFDMYVPTNFGRNGLGLDDKSRYDFYISERHVALFQDGQLIKQSPIPAGTFGWVNQTLKVYYTHYVYHTLNDIVELTTGTNVGQNNCYPMNAYWFNDPVNGTSAGQTICNRAYPPGFGFRYSDERHWDNMGFETFPATEVPANDYSSFLSNVRLPVVRPPTGGVITGPTAPRAPSNVRILQ